MTYFRGGIYCHWWGSRHATPKYGTSAYWISWRNFEKMTEAGGSLWPSQTFSPERGHETLLWEVLSLFPEKKSTLISEDKGTHRRLLISRPYCSPSLVRLPHISTQHLLFIKSNMKMLRLLSSELHFLMNVPASCKTWINVCAFFLLKKKKKEADILFYLFMYLF